MNTTAGTKSADELNWAFLKLANGDGLIFMDVEVTQARPMIETILRADGNGWIRLVDVRKNHVSYLEKVFRLTPAGWKIHAGLKALFQ